MYRKRQSTIGDRFPAVKTESGDEELSQIGDSDTDLKTGSGRESSGEQNDVLTAKLVKKRSSSTVSVGGAHSTAASSRKRARTEPEETPEQEKKSAKRVPKKSKNEIIFEEAFEDSAGIKIEGLRRAKIVAIEPEVDCGGSHRPTKAEREHIYPTSAQNKQQDHVDTFVYLHEDDEVLRDLVEEKLNISLTVIDKKSYPDTSPRAKKQTEGAETRTRLNLKEAPVSTIEGIFQILARKLSKTPQFAEACRAFEDSGLRILTMCSGTESPLLALQLLGDALAQQGVSELPIKHLGSAEIEPFKQAYIQRNFNPPVLFRDVTQFAKKDSKPHTAYGGTAPQPEDVHILVAGSSCVDYSTLNIKPKAFGQAGQSYDTLEGVRSYAKNYRPAIIVLENVKSAPWLDIQKHFAGIDYYGVVVMVDTKDFYLPQTRQRGYMVAFDRLRAKEIGLDLEDAAKILVRTLVELAQRASSPYTDFIFADDDSELRDSERVVAKLERNSDVDAKVSDWTKCRIRHSEFRTEFKLGTMKPMTKWRNNGKCQFMDHAWVRWALIQRERIWDTLDIDFLYFVARADFDMNFKSKWIDTSQNVDRSVDSTPWGVVGCITPSGLPYDTRRGGPVFGKEVLALQGIPAKNLSLNKESSSQLQDLAGNAMSTTVICAVLAAAITASLNPASALGPTKSNSIFKHVENASSDVIGGPSPLESQPKASDICQLMKTSKNLLEHKLVSTRPSKYAVNLSNTLLDARLALQLCRCEGATNRKSGKFKICKACGHTACEDCAGNPAHRYADLTSSFLKIRKEPKEVIQELNQLLPPLLRLSLTEHSMSALVGQLASKVKDFEEHNYRISDTKAHGPAKSQAPKISHEDLARYKKAVMEALNSTVYLQSIKHGRMWRVTYESSSAFIELQLAPHHNHAESSHGFSTPSNLMSTWYLYALPDKDEPAQCWLRDVLANPIARFIPTKKGLFDGRWEIWTPSMPVIDLKFKGKNETKSWEKSIGINDEKFQDLKMFSELTITSKMPSYSGIGESAPIDEIKREICGVYQLEQACGAANGSLYRKKEKLVGDKKSIFFFLDPKNIGNAALDRFVFADDHERLPLGVQRHVVAEMPRGWRPSTKTISLKESVFSCRLINCWISTDDLSFNSSEDTPALDFWIPTPYSDVVTSIADCNTASTLFITKLPETDAIQSKQWKDKSRYTVDMVGRPGSLSQYQWLLKQVHRILPLGEHDIKFDSMPTDCQCAPQAPTLEWLISRKTNSETLSIKPFENGKAATDYEHALKNRPSPVVAVVHWHGKEGYLEVEVNIATLVHRVCRHIMTNGYSTMLK